MSRKFILLSAVFLVGFLAFGAYSLFTISTIKVNGPAYRQILLQKYLVADILPPPEYIIETFLTTLRLRDKGVETAQGSRGAMEQIRASSQQVKDMIASLSASMREQVGAMKELSRAVGSVNEMSQGISAATEEQTTNAKQVSKALESVNELTQAASSSAGEMSAGTEQLADMARQLRALVGQFKVARDDTRKPAVARVSVELD